MQYVLEMQGISKSFAGMKALDDASLYLREGECRALLGINGAGKSTMIKILSGVYHRDKGDIIINGKPVKIESPNDALENGIAAVYQDPQMVESFAGYENIYLGSEGKCRLLFSGINRRKLKKQAKELVAQYPFEIDVNRPVYLMTSVEREIIAILRALSKNCRILILDEPTSILTEKEKYILFEFIHTLKRKGVSIIYITHHLDEVAQVCDSFTIFRNGRVITHEDIKDGKVNSSYIAELMLGERLEQLYPEKNRGAKVSDCLRVEGLSMKGKFQDISFQARRGEIYGIFGLVGSGIDEISKALYGAMDISGGTIQKDGKTLRLTGPGKAIREGIFLVPANRKTEGFLHNIEISANIIVARLEKAVGKLKIISAKKEEESSRQLVDQLSIATPSLKKKVNELSGGNQQKVVVAKGLYTDADVYIFTEPTVGVDVGAKSAIYETMRELTKRAAVIIISSEPEEVLGNADRIMVIYQGSTTMEKDAEKVTLKEMLIHAITNNVEEYEKEAEKA